MRTSRDYCIYKKCFGREHLSENVMNSMTKIRFCNLYSCVIIAEDVNLLKNKIMNKDRFTKEGMRDYEF